MRKDSKESGVRTSNSIISVDSGNGADHALQHLIAELALTPRGFSTLFSLTEAALHLPDGGHGDQQARHQSEHIPGSNRSRCFLLHRVDAKEHLLLFAGKVIDNAVKFLVGVAELRKTLLRIVSAIPRDFDIGGKIVPKLAPAGHL